MELRDFDYELPPDLIAQEPVTPRDASRLMVVRRESGRIEHRIFRDLPQYLRPEDVLVLNDTRVLPARLLGVRPGTGGHVELLLLRRLDASRWEVLARPGRRVRPGSTVSFGDGGLLATVLETTESGGRIVEFQYEGVFEEVLDQLGQIPLPPYITRALEERERYQTVYSREKGSAAAPTAGLHFTPELLDRVRGAGIETLFLTLHVGLGTFRPVQVERIEEHRMHAEYYSVSRETAAAINLRRSSGGRVVAVGTTTTRTLESAARAGGEILPGSGWTDIFIYPGYRFKAVDALVTNFHLPRSTLLMLVSAFAGRDLMLEAYREAIREKYRFFSFGDAMLIL